MGKRAAVTGLVLLALAGCSGGGGGPAKARGATATTAVGGDEAAKFTDVLAGLDGVMGDLQRILVKQRKLTPDVTDRLRAVYTGPELLNQIDAFRTDVDNGLVGYKANPGNRITTVTRLITASPICVFAEVNRDYSPVAEGFGSRPSKLYVILVTKNDAEDPKHLNPTPWAMLYDGVQSDGSQPDDVCR